MKNEKGFTLIESLVAFAIASMVLAALSTVIVTTYRYYTASNKIKALSDQQYQAVLNPKTSSTDSYTLTCNVDDKKASIDHLTLTTNTSKSYDDVTIAYFNLTNDTPLTDKTTQQLTNTVYDRLQFKNSTNDKGEWSQNKASTYRKGDFVTYQDRQYVLVTDRNQIPTWSSQYSAPGTYQSGWQLLDMYNPIAPLFTTYLDGDILLQDNGGSEIQAFVYLNNGFTWIGAYDLKTHEIKKEHSYSYDQNTIHYFDEWKEKQMYLLDSWKKS